MSVPRKQDGWRPGTPQDLEAMYQFKKRFRELKMLLELVESGKLDMKVIRGLLPPEMDSDAANKGYVDDELAKTRPNTWNPNFLTDKDNANYRNGLQYSGSPTNPLYMAVWDTDDSATGTQPNRRVRSINAEGARALMGAAPAGYGLEATTRPPNNSLDELHTNGWYQCGSGLTGAPTGHKNVEYGTVFVINRYGKHTTQYYVTQPESIVGSPLMLVRNYSVSTETWNPWEWINPPMLAGVEYRTTERYMGKSVYVKLIDCQGMPSGVNAAKAVQHNSANVESIVSFGGNMSVGGTKPIALPYYFSDTNLARIAVDYQQVRIFNGGTDLKGYTDAKVWFKYTKTTG